MIKNYFDGFENGNINSFLKIKIYYVGNKITPKLKMTQTGYYIT